MTDVPSSGWEAWIITTVLGMLGSVVATVVVLSRFIQGLYQSRITSLEAAQEKSTEEINALQVEARKCVEDRAELRGECAILRMRIDQLELTKKQ